MTGGRGSGDRRVVAVAVPPPPRRCHGDGPGPPPGRLQPARRGPASPCRQPAPSPAWGAVVSLSPSPHTAPPASCKGCRGLDRCSVNIFVLHFRPARSPTAMRGHFWQHSAADLVLGCLKIIGVYLSAPILHNLPVLPALCLYNKFISIPVQADAKPGSTMCASRNNLFFQMILSAKLTNDKHLLLKQETYSPPTPIFWVLSEKSMLMLPSITCRELTRRFL